MAGLLDRDLEPGADGRERREDAVVAVAPDVRALAASRRGPSPAGCRKYSHQSAKTSTSARDARSLTSDALTPSAASARCTPIDAASTPSPSRMIANSPWRSAMWCGCQLVGALALRPQRARRARTTTSATKIASSASSDSTPASASDEPQHPADLGDRDPRRRSAARSSRLSGSSIAARSHCAIEADAHDQVADRDRPVVAVVERGRHAGGEHEHAGHLDQGQQPERDVVGVERRREPRVVHPRPPDREEHLQERARARRARGPSSIAWAKRLVRAATAITNVRSNSSSSGLAVRCGSSIERAVMRMRMGGLIRT